jgi:hypothetical protein
LANEVLCLDGVNAPYGDIRLFGDSIARLASEAISRATR